MAAPTLGGTTLAYPTDYNYDYGFRGGRRIMADGTIVTDLVNTNAKREFEMRWQHITWTEVSAILTGFAAIKDTSGTFVDIHGTSYTVTQAQGGTPLRVETVRKTGGYLYSVTMRLRQA